MRRNTPRALTVDDIFQAVKDGVLGTTTTTTTTKLTGSNVATTGLTPVTSNATINQEAFDDALHKLVNTPRVKTATDIQALCTILSELTVLCTDDSHRWVSWVLTLIHRRYHLKSPQAQQELRQNDNHDNDTVLTGDGERLLFYVSVLYIFYYALQDKNSYNSSSAVAAVQVLCQVAPVAGGTRDICSLLELLLRAMLDEYLTSVQDDPRSPLDEHSSTFVAEALQGVVTLLRTPGVVQVATDMLDLIAETLKSDLEIVTSATASKTDDDDDVTMKTKQDVTDTFKQQQQQQQQQQYPSTFHVFLPHHDRGRANKNKKKRPHDEGNKAKRMTNRALVQSVAEILIWSHTAPNDAGIQSAYVGLLAHNKDDNSDITNNNNQIAKMCWHRIQTIARKRRQILNAYARDRGFMLANLFSLDATAIRMSQIKRAKAADLHVLTKLASKKGNHDILKLVAARFAANPDKTPPAASVSEIISSWVPLDKPPHANDEVYQLESQIQRAKVRATLQKLRSIRPDDVSKQVMIVCLEPSKLNKAASVLLRAAFCENLVLDEQTEEQATQATTLARVMHSLDAVAAGTSSDEEIEKDTYFPSMRGDDGMATTKAVMNFLERHVADNTAILFLTAANLRLPVDEVKKLLNRGVYIHCHDADDIGHRLDREKAKSGDVTISLAWDTEDDLDLHVTIPSGEELSFRNKVSACNKGVLDVDMNACGPYSKEPVENVFLGSLEDKIQAPVGKYKVVVQNYAYHARGSDDSTQIPWRVRIQANGATTNHEGACLGTGRSSDVNVCEFEYHGRTIPFPQELEGQSAFGTANMVGVTASTGQTLESLRNLMKVAWELQELDRVRQLVSPEEGINEPAEENGDDIDMEEMKGPERPTTAKHLEVTSRDRLNMVLCRLPAHFHRMVSRAFGTESMIRTCSLQVSRRMLEDDIPLGELERSGYPPDVVSSVKELMKKGAVPAA